MRVTAGMRSVIQLQISYSSFNPLWTNLCYCPHTAPKVKWTGYLTYRLDLHILLFGWNNRHDENNIFHRIWKPCMTYEQCIHMVNVYILVWLLVGLVLIIIILLCEKSPPKRLMIECWVFLFHGPSSRWVRLRLSEATDRCQRWLDEQSSDAFNRLKFTSADFRHWCGNESDRPNEGRPECNILLQMLFTASVFSAAWAACLQERRSSSLESKETFWEVAADCLALPEANSISFGWTITGYGSLMYRGSSHSQHNTSMEAFQKYFKFYFTTLNGWRLK